MKTCFVLVLVFLLGFTGLADAQNDFGEDDAIAIAAQDVLFAAGLADHPNWTAAAYDTGNAYSIWRVQFWSSDGEDLGWADVSAERGRVFAYEAYFGATDAQIAQAYETITAFISSQPDILELIANPLAYDIYVDYDGYSDVWGVYIDRGSDSLYLLVDFSDDFAFTDPSLEAIYFAEVLSYDEWRETSEGEAAAVAAAHHDVARLLRDAEGWTTSAEPQDGGRQWLVHFMAGGEPLGWALVDLRSAQVIEFGAGSN